MRRGLRHRHPDRGRGQETPGVDGGGERHSVYVLGLSANKKRDRKQDSDTTNDSGQLLSRTASGGTVPIAWGPWTRLTLLPFSCFTRACPTLGCRQRSLLVLRETCSLGSLLVRRPRPVVSIWEARVSPWCWTVAISCPAWVVYAA